MTYYPSLMKSINLHIQKKKQLTINTKKIISGYIQTAENLSAKILKAAKREKSYYIQGNNNTNKG